MSKIQFDCGCEHADTNNGFAHLRRDHPVISAEQAMFVHLLQQGKVNAMIEVGPTRAEIEFRFTVTVLDADIEYIGSVRLPEFAEVSITQNHKRTVNRHHQPAPDYYPYRMSNGKFDIAVCDRGDEPHYPIHDRTLRIEEHAGPFRSLSAACAWIGRATIGRW